MKNLEIEGLTSLSKKEMLAKNGGCWEVFVAAFLLDSLMNPTSCLEAMKSGYESY